MREFFAERTAALKHLLQVHFVYWHKFHENGCRWDSRRNVLAHSEAEEIDEILESAEGLKVVTKGNGPCRHRYHLKYVDHTWLICEIDTEAGGGWNNSKRKMSGDLLTARRRPHRVKARFAGHLSGPIEDADHLRVEQFMSDYFRERTASWTKEAEIYGTHVKSFYSSECDWRRWVATPKTSDAERIESIAMVPSGAHVITGGFHRHRSRYRLHSTGHQWSIRQVDMECPFCADRGHSPDCFWCKGTIWEHVRP